MKNDPRLKELREVLDTLAKFQIHEDADQVNVIIEKPVDIEAVDQALLRAVHAEPLDRFERADSWHIRVMKRDQERPSDLRYEAVRVIDNYFEYRRLAPDRQ